MVMDKEKLIDMFKLQDELNRKINENWLKIRRKEDFARAIWIECAELVDSLPWKWWKKQNADINNVKIEIVDMWHFIMSYILLDYPEYDRAVESEYIRYMGKGLSENYEHLEINPVYIHSYLGRVDTTDRLIYSIERVVEGFLSENIKQAMFFYGLAINRVMDFDEMYLLYVGKNILNHIRQEFGYKEGKYIKEIKGIEDNKYMFEIVKQVKSKEQLEKMLRDKFKEILKLNSET